MQVNNVNKIPFGARIQVQKLQKYAFILNELQRTSPPSLQVSTGANYLSSCESTISAVSTGKTTAAGSGVVGTAFSVDAFGVNMSNIVPSVVAKVAPSSGPETVALSVEHPEAVGGFFSTAAVWMNKHFNINFANKQIRKFPT